MRTMELDRPVRADTQAGPLRVLVAVDGSAAADQAARRLGRLVDGGGTRIRLLTVLSSGMGPSAYAGVPWDDAESEGLVASAVESAVARAREALERAGFAVEVTHRLGNPAEGILREIEEWGPDLVVMGRRGLGVPARWLMGSVSERVLRNAHVPVLVVS